MTKKEIIMNVWNLAFIEQAIPPVKITYKTTVVDLTERLRNVMFERFVSEVVTDSELCGVSPMDSRKFAIDFIHNSDYVQNCLTAAVNLVLNGAFSKKWQLDGFIDKLLYVHVVKACLEKLNDDE